MAYSEATFLLASIATLLAIARKERLFVVALLAGIASSTRPVGIALVLPVVMYARGISATWHGFAVRCAYSAALALSGLIAYMAFLGAAFGDPLAFASTQSFWQIGSPAVKDDKVLSLLALEPIWRVYDSRYPGYWRKLGSVHAGWNLQFANPIYLVSAAAVLFIGIRRRLLNEFEAAFSTAVLLIPYVTRASEMCCASQGRFAAVAFPLYFVVAQLLAPMSRLTKWALAATAAVLLCLYTFAFGVGEPFF